MAVRLLLTFFIALTLFSVFNRKSWEQNMYSYDTKGYYQYLPALFIKHDIWHVYQPEASPDDRTPNKYALGTTISELPFFLCAHGYVLASGAYEANGYTAPYQWSGMLASLFWTVAGLWALGRFLGMYFSARIVFCVLFCLAFGTNLYHYTVFSPGMSHPFSFFLFSAILLVTARFYAADHKRDIYILALLLGIVTITRPVNLAVAILPLFWEVNSIDSLKVRMRLFRKHFSSITLAGIVFLAVVFIQLSYWKYVTGQWVYYSYKGEHFFFSNPQIIKGLFSFRKGWVVYTPMVLFAFAGLPVMRRKQPQLIPAILVFMAVLIYLVFSWGNWWYGGGFGCRPLIEALAIMALPLGYFIEYISNSRVVLKSVIAALGLCFIVLNTFQSYQSYLHVLHHDRMTWAYYKYIFGKTEIDAATAQKYLMDDKEYWEEIRRINY